jgi:hypothetical protein
MCIGITIRFRIKLFSGFVITGFNTGRGRRGYKVVAQGIPLRIVGYVERIVPGLTNRQFQTHFRVSRSSFEKFVPIIKNMIKKCIRTWVIVYFTYLWKFRVFLARHP